MLIKKYLLLTLCFGIIFATENKLIELNLSADNPYARSEFPGYIYQNSSLYLNLNIVNQSQDIVILKNEPTIKRNIFLRLMKKDVSGNYSEKDRTEYQEDIKTSSEEPVRIGKKEALSSKFDLADYFSLDEPGDYKVQSYYQDEEYLLENLAPHEQLTGFYQSNEFEFSIKEKKYIRTPTLALAETAYPCYRSSYASLKNKALLIDINQSKLFSNMYFYWDNIYENKDLVIVPYLNLRNAFSTFYDNAALGLKLSTLIPGYNGIPSSVAIFGSTSVGRVIRDTSDKRETIEKNFSDIYYSPLFLHEYSNIGAVVSFDAGNIPFSKGFYPLQMVHFGFKHSYFRKTNDLGLIPEWLSVLALEYPIFEKYGNIFIEGITPLGKNSKQFDTTSIGYISPPQTWQFESEKDNKKYGLDLYLKIAIISYYADNEAKNQNSISQASFGILFW